MQSRFTNPEAAKMDEGTASSALLRMSIVCVAEMAADKSTEAGQHSDLGFNKLFSKYLASRGLQSSYRDNN
jgi:hypothetical protein